MGAVLISRSQPKILRKIQKNLRGYIPAIPRFLHVWLDAQLNQPRYQRNIAMQCANIAVGTKHNLQSRHRFLKQSTPC